MDDVELAGARAPRANDTYLPQVLKREFVAADARYFHEPYTGEDVVYPSNVPYEPDSCDDRSGPTP